MTVFLRTRWTYCDRRIFLVLMLGLLIRIPFCFFYGTQDMEFWKAFGTDSVRNGVTRTYGASDSEIISLFKQGFPLDEIIEKTQKVIYYQAHAYSRTEYRNPQPPLYIYPIHASSWLYSQWDSELKNTRLFNFFINLAPVLASFFTAIIIYFFVRAELGPLRAALALVVYWYNPTIFLNSPIQGYLDPIFALLSLCSILFLFKKRLILAYVFLVAGFLHKPQGILIVPVVFVVGILEHSLLKNMKAWLAAVATGLVIFLPFIWEGRFLSSLLAISTTTAVSGDLSRQALNPWWIVQFVSHAIDGIESGAVKLLPAILGGPSNWSADYPQKAFVTNFGFNLKPISSVLLLVYFGWLCSVCRKAIGRDRWNLFLGAGLAAFGFFILRIGVQINHYYLLLPLLSVVSVRSAHHLRMYGWVSLFFILPDLGFYGFGRDLLLPFASVLSAFYAGWMTNVWALFGTGLFTRASVVFSRGLSRNF